MTSVLRSSPAAPMLTSFTIQATLSPPHRSTSRKVPSWTHTPNLAAVPSHTFTAQLAVPTAVGTISFNRGWSSVDATLDGQTFRFIDTHLDIGAFEPVQLAQAHELLTGADPSGLPAVYVGDFNTSANDPSDPTFATYQALLNG